MVTLGLVIYLATLSALILVVGITALVHRLRANRMQRLENLLSQRYMRIVTAVMLSNESLPSRFPMIECRGAKEVLARVLATVGSSVYGPDTAIVGRIAIDNGVDYWLLRRVKRTRGLRRAYYISLLACLPLSSRVVAQVERYDDDRNRFVRFYALMIRIMGDASSALRSLVEFGEPLNDFEMAEIMARLRRGMLPVACEPLLASQSRNLRILGLNIAREFGVEETKPLLLEMAASECDAEVARAAIYALVAMRSSLAHRHIAAGVRSMSALDRQALCRRLALEGYSAPALEQLFGGREGDYAQRLVATYKRRIVCTSQL